MQILRAFALLLLVIDYMPCSCGMDSETQVVTPRNEDERRAYLLYNQASSPQTGDKQKVELYMQVLELKPDLAEAYNNLGLTLSRLGDDKIALRYWKLGIHEALMQGSNKDMLRASMLNNIGFVSQVSLSHSNRLYRARLKQLRTTD